MQAYKTKKSARDEKITIAFIAFQRVDQYTVQHQLTCRAVNDQRI